MAKSIEQGGIFDTKLKVFEVDRLLLIDASIIPVISDCRIQMTRLCDQQQGWSVLSLRLALRPDLLLTVPYNRVPI